jgi:proteasome lid subunit RPN8/RPN11
MKVFLKMESGVLDALMAHLLPPESRQEQAAFLFARAARSDHAISLETAEMQRLGPSDFVVQEDDYLEMTDATRAALIKRAHDLDASLVELHSHPGPWPAGFSDADRAGLKETVPHMWWRLKKRPYLAIVVAPSGFDALVWLDDPKMPRPLDAILAGSRLLRPTNRSLGGWDDRTAGTL